MENEYITLDCDSTNLGKTTISGVAKGKPGWTGVCPSYSIYLAFLHCKIVVSSGHHFITIWALLSQYGHF